MTGNIPVTLVSSPKTGKSYQVYRALDSFHSGYDPESLFYPSPGQALWNNSLTCDELGGQRFSWSFNLVYLYNENIKPRGYALNGYKADTSESYAWTIWVREGQDLSLMPKRKLITINNSSGVGLSDYQVQIDIPYSVGMKSDFGDIRFMSGDNMKALDYWMESKTNGSNARFWVRVPSIPVGDTMIYTYFGNSSAVSQSSGQNTFVFFEDFNKDYSKWTRVVNTGSTNMDSSIVAITGGGSHEWWMSNQKWSMPVTARVRMKFSSETSGSEEVMLDSRNLDISGTTNIMSFYYASSDGKKFNSYSNGVRYAYPSTQTFLNWSVVEMKSSSTQAQWYNNGSLVYSTNTNVPQGDKRFTLIGYGGSTLYVDWALIRKHSLVEPTISIGATEDL
ncbi:hypothetical protein MNSC_11410 [Minisyncoccus archaeophilus]|uniref:DUF2341 domain-containing protein n=1 Tax=Minisyncoccus archaeiphilus TaxID=3238481 RepID=UPI00399CF3AA